MGSWARLVINLMGSRHAAAGCTISGMLAVHGLSMGLGKIGKGIRIIEPCFLLSRDLVRHLMCFLCPAYPNKRAEWMYRKRQIDACVMNEDINIPHSTPRGSGKSYQFLLDPGMKNVHM